MSEWKIQGSKDFIDNVCLYDFEESIKASKYPMAVDTDKATEEMTKTVLALGNSPIGAGHDNFLNGFRIAFDLTFSIKAWVEMERYHFVDFVSSQSTMHRICKFSIPAQCNQYVDDRIINIVQEFVLRYNELKELLDRDIKAGIKDSPYEYLCREAYLDVLYNIPSGFQLTARLTTDYRQLKTIYYQRYNHRLPEWRAFCEWMLSLPLFKEVCLNGKKD